MKEALLLIVVLLIFAGGFLLMKKIDGFIDENKKAVEDETENIEPSCVMLTDEISDEEIVEELRRFRKSHKKTCIVIYSPADKEMPGDSGM